MSRFRNAFCHASGMQFVTLQECNLSHLGMYKKSCTKFIFLSGVVALVVSLSRRQMAKVVMGTKKKELEPGVKTEKTEHKCSLNAVKSAWRTVSTRESSSA